MTKEALKSAIEFAEYCLEELDLSHMASNQAKRLVQKSKEALSSPNGEAQPEQEKERCVGCEACIDTACGRDECPKGWPKALQPEQEPAVFLKEWSDWRDMVVVNIMRHGSIDKHLARELANHFQSMTPQPKEPEQEPVTVIRLGQCANQDCDGGPLQQGCWAHDCSWSLLRSEQKPVGWKLVPIEPTNEMLKAMDECSTEGYDERLYAGHAASVYMAAVDVAPNPPEARNQEPVAWMYQDKSTHEVRFQKHMRDFVDHGATYETPLYTTPPQRTWVGLTDEELELLNDCGDTDSYKFARAIEAKLKEKNT